MNTLKLRNYLHLKRAFSHFYYQKLQSADLIFADCSSVKSHAFWHKSSDLYHIFKAWKLNKLITIGRKATLAWRPFMV